LCRLRDIADKRSEPFFESIARKPGKVSEHFAIVGRNSW
jgi:hypothetical protein